LPEQVPVRHTDGGTPAREATSGPLVGVDVGGTKTHIAVQVPGHDRRDVILASAQWRTGQLFSDPANLDRLAACVRTALAGLAPTRTVLGMHGLDTPQQQRTATERLDTLLPGAVLALNDARLLGPACGLRECLQLIVGTGAIAIGTDARGDTLTADGYGALLADTGSAPALVREVVRAGLRLADEQGPAAALADPVLSRLCRIYATDQPADLALAVAEEDPYDWGRHAPVVFEACRAGSVLARDVLRQAADRLAGNLAAVSRRGAVGTVVVGAGGVLTGQPLLQDLLTEALQRLAPGLRLRILDVPPVDGALALAAAR